MSSEKQITFDEIKDEVLWFGKYSKGENKKTYNDLLDMQFCGYIEWLRGNNIMNGYAEVQCLIDKFDETIVSVKGDTREKPARKTFVKRTYVKQSVK